MLYKYSGKYVNIYFNMKITFPNTYQGISWMALPPAPLTSARGHSKNDSCAVVLGGGGGLSPTPPANYLAGS